MRGNNGVGLPSLKVFRDPLYNYIPYSRLDGQVIDSPLFQRLRYVSQNALAHLTYEMNRTSRFSHSLGCMHVGGRLLLAGLYNADPAVSRRFQGACEAVITRLCTQITAQPNAIRTFLRGDRDPFYVHAGLVFTDGGSAIREVTLVALLEGVRLACVIHDIGHPPFSHTLEGVLEAQLEGRPIPPGQPAPTARAEFSAALTRVQPTLERQLHERIGEVVIDEVFASSVTLGSSVFFQQLCLRLAKAIASGEADFQDDENVIATLHELVSGDLDADRADYIGRDGFACGFEFGTYDLERIIMSTRVIQDGARFKFRPSTTALSAVESFFIERLRIYRWLVFHHNVVRGHVALQRGTQLLLDLCLDAGGEAEVLAVQRLQEFLASELPPLWRNFDPGRDDIAKYKRVDENWLMALFTKVLDHPSMQDPTLPEPLALIRVYLRFVCERDKRLRPVWKRLSGYRRFADALLAEARKPEYEAFFQLPPNVSLKPGESSSVEFANALFKRQLAARQDNLVVPGGELALFERFEQDVEAAWATGNCPGKLVFHFASRVKPGPSVRGAPGTYEAGFSLVDEAGALVELAELSPQVAELESVWGKDIQAFAFLIPGERRGANFVVSEEDMDASVVTNELAQAVAKVLLQPEWRASVLVAA